MWSSARATAFNRTLHDSERIIDEVEKRPALYDRSHEEYKNADIKRRMWNDVCTVLIPNWKQLSVHDKFSKRAEIQMRWKHIRDNFKKEVRMQRQRKQHKQQRHKEQDGSSSKRRKYVFFDRLLFLLPAVERCKLEESYCEEEFIDTDDQRNDVTEQISDQSNGQCIETLDDLTVSILSTESESIRRPIGQMQQISSDASRSGMNIGTVLNIVNGNTFGAMNSIDNMNTIDMDADHIHNINKLEIPDTNSINEIEVSNMDEMSQSELSMINMHAGKMSPEDIAIHGMRQNEMNTVESRGHCREMKCENLNSVDEMNVIGEMNHREINVIVQSGRQELNIINEIKNINQMNHNIRDDMNFNDMGQTEISNIREMSHYELPMNNRSIDKLGQSEMHSLEELNQSQFDRLDEMSQIDPSQMYAEPHRYVNNNQRSRMNNYSQPVWQTSEDEKQDSIDEDRMFLLSLVPSLKKMDDEKKLIVKTEFLNILRNIQYPK